MGCDCDTIWGVWLWSWSLGVVSEGDGGAVGCDCGLLGVWLRHMEAPRTDTVQPHWVCALPSRSHRERSQLVVGGLKRRAGSRGSSCCRDPTTATAAAPQRTILLDLTPWSQGWADNQVNRAGVLPDPTDKLKVKFQPRKVLFLKTWLAF